jgi:hypothetical protein
LRTYYFSYNPKPIYSSYGNFEKALKVLRHREQIRIQIKRDYAVSKESVVIVGRGKNNSVAHVFFKYHCLDPGKGKNPGWIQINDYPFLRGKEIYTRE